MMLLAGRTGSEDAERGRLVRVFLRQHLQLADKLSALRCKLFVRRFCSMSRRQADGFVLVVVLVLVIEIYFSEDENEEEKSITSSARVSDP